MAWKPGKACNLQRQKIFLKKNKKPLDIQSCMCYNPKRKQKELQKLIKKCTYSHVCIEGRKNNV